MFKRSARRLALNLQSPFLRNIGTVATGSAIAQAIAIASSPVVTRLYGPEALGLLGLFVTLAGMMAVVASMGYPTAIVLPAEDGDALALGALSIFVGLVCSLLFLVLILSFGEHLLYVLNASELLPYSFLLPIATLMSVVDGVAGQWLVRAREFRIAARLAVLRAAVLSAGKVGFGLAHPTAIALILVNIIGGIIATVFMFIWFIGKQGGRLASAARAGFSFSHMKAVAQRYSDFPLLRTPQNLINGFSQGLPILLLASFFGPGAAGQYALALAVLGMPAGLIGGAVMSVFYPRVSEAVRDGEDARRLIIKATQSMALVSFLPFLLLICFAPEIFAFVFGGQWRTAGVYAQWLAPWLFMQFINRPAVVAVAPLKLQGGLLVYEIFSTGSKILALWLGFHVFQSDVAAVALFSCFGIAAYLWLILWVVRNSDRKPEKMPIAEALR